MPPKEKPLKNSEGPLTERQLTVLDGLTTGLRHAEISKTHGINLTVVRQEAAAIVRKMRCSTSAHAVAVYSQAVTYRSVAKRLRDGMIRDAQGFVTDEHVNHVLDGLALIYEERAASRLPK
jgi:DNA-binding CsgD family transcriptional regulator